MKNTKITKIITLAIAMATLVCACFCIVSSADDAPTVEIVAKNASYGDRIQIAFAVATSTEGAEVEVIYYTEDPTANANAVAYTAEKSDKITYDHNGTQCPVFYTFGIPAKDLANSIYARAHIVGTEIYSDYTVYSVAEYIYARLYKHNVIAATEGDALVEKNLYTSLIEYASNAQLYLEDESETLLKDYYYAYVADGTLDGKEDSAIFDPDNASVTLNYTGTDKNVIGWTATTYENGVATAKDVAKNAELTLTGHTVFTPRFLAPLTEGETFESLNYTGKQGSGNIIGHYGNQSGGGWGIVNPGDSIGITADPTDATNKVLQFVDGSSSSSTSIFINNNQISKAHSVFETKMYIDAASLTRTGDTYIYTLSFVAGRTVTNYSFHLQLKGAGTEFTYARLYENSPSSTPYLKQENDIYTLSNSIIPVNEWFIFRAEYHNTGDIATSYVEFFVNGESIGKSNRYKASTVANDVNGFVITDYSSGLSTVYFDNMSFTEKAITE